MSLKSQQEQWSGILRKFRDWKDLVILDHLDMFKVIEEAFNLEKSEDF